MHTNRKIFDVNIFKRLAYFSRSIYSDDISLEQATEKQAEMKYLFRNLKVYHQRNSEKIIYRDEVLKNTRTFVQGRDLIMLFEDDIFPLAKVSQHKNPKDEKYPFSNKLVDITEEVKNINRELFQKHLKFQMPGLMLRDLYRINNKKKNNELVNMIQSGLSDLEDEIEKISEKKKRTGQSDRMVDIAEEILDFNNQNQNQKGEGLKILTPDQIHSRL